MKIRLLIRTINYNKFHLVPFSCVYYSRIGIYKYIVSDCHKLNQQEGEVEKCRSCELVFHKNCFKKLATCPCGARFKQEETKRSSGTGIQRADGNSITVAGKAESGSGILASLFSKVLPLKSQIPRKLEAEGAGNVISMGSLPSTNL